MVEQNAQRPRRPNKEPPAPPLPPKEVPVHSYKMGIYRMPRSERACSEAPSHNSIAYSTQSLQPSASSYLPRSTRCESEYGIQSDSFRSCCSGSNCTLPLQVFNTRPTCCVRTCSQVRLCCDTLSQSSYQSAPPVINHLINNRPPPPVPKERKNIRRPRLSISPMPELKHAQRTPRSFQNPGNYKRHIEQHTERLFKYLSDRSARFDALDADINNMGVGEDNAKGLRSMLVTQENRHLRSLRSRVRPEDFKIIKRLGAGVIGNVTLVERVTPNLRNGEKRELYAMKRLRKSQVVKGNQLGHVFAERDFLGEAENDWIVKLYATFQDDDYLYFILAYIPGGDLMSLLQKKYEFDEDMARFYIAEISSAVQYVHDKNFSHRDIKPDNILIDRDGHIKLADFGLCTGFRREHDASYYADTIDPAQEYDGTLDPGQTITKRLTKLKEEYSARHKEVEVVGSPDYIAPELLRLKSDCRCRLCSSCVSNNRDQKSNIDVRLCDWWSVGVILYEMVVGYVPFVDIDRLTSNKNPYSMSGNERARDVQQRIIHWRNYLTFPVSKRQTLSRPCIELIEGWLCEQQERLCRHGIDDIKKHPFFASIDWEGIRSQPAPYRPELRDEMDTQNFSPEEEMQPYEYYNTHKPPNAETPVWTINDFTLKAFWKST